MAGLTAPAIGSGVPGVGFGRRASLPRGTKVTFGRNSAGAEFTETMSELNILAWQPDVSQNFVNSPPRLSAPALPAGAFSLEQETRPRWTQAGSLSADCRHGGFKRDPGPPRRLNPSIGPGVPAGVFFTRASVHEARGGTAAPVSMNGAVVAKVTAVGEAMIDDLLRGSRWS
jgi:hypothetical protein